MSRLPNSSRLPLLSFSCSSSPDVALHFVKLLFGYLISPPLRYAHFRDARYAYCSRTAIVGGRDYLRQPFTGRNLHESTQSLSSSNDRNVRDRGCPESRLR